ncbi:MAG: LacI family DNA-binding transcriptional regulator [Burkholderia sp.]
MATVSKFVNGSQRFTDPVEARLKAAIARLGYRSNAHARSTATGETRIIGIAVLDLCNPHFTSIIKGANRIALQFGYTVLLIDLEESLSRQHVLIDTLAHRVDGIVLSTRIVEEEMAKLATLRKPVVFINHAGNDSQITSVSADNELAGFMLAQHLLNRGYREIGFLGYPVASGNAPRLAGVRRCLASAGLSPRVFEAGSPSTAAGELAGSSILLGPMRPQALICFNDLIAIGVLKEIKALGTAGSNDIAVCGFDNISHCQYTHPQLTSVDMQSEKLGEIAMLRVLDALAGQPSEGTTLLEPRLIMRESTPIFQSGDMTIEK